MFPLVLMEHADSGCKEGTKEVKVADVIVLAVFVEHSIGVWPVSELLGRQIKCSFLFIPSSLSRHITMTKSTETGLVYVCECELLH